MSDRLSRAAALARLAAVPLAAAGVAAGTAAADADSKSPQNAVQYQNHPKDGKKCAQCRFYLVNKKNPKADGGCQVVQGRISPNGWCVVYAPKA